MEQKNNRYKALARDTGLFALSSFGSKILLFLLTPLYTSILLTEEYGIADILVTTVDFIYPILTLAISESALRFALDRAASKKSVFTMSVSYVFISTALLFLAFPFVGAFSETIKEYYLYFCLIYFLFNIHSVFANFVKGIDKTKIFAIQGLLQTATVIGSNIIFLLGFKIGLDGYLLSIVMGYAVSTCFMLFAARLYSFISLKSFDGALNKEMLKYSIPMIPTILAWAVNTSIDKYMIIGFVGLGASGIYSVAHKIPSLITTVLLVFIQAWQISAINAHGKDDESEFYSKTYAVLNILCIAGVCALLPLTKFISGLLFSKDFYAAWQFVPFLCISAVFSSLAGFLASGFRAAKKTGDLFTSVAVGAVMNIVLNLALLKLLGTIGAAIATAASFFAVWIVRVVTIQKIVRVKVSYPKSLLSYALLFLMCFVYCYELPFFSIIYAVSMLALVILNIGDISMLIKSVISIAKKVLFKKKSV